MTITKYKKYNKCLICKKEKAEVWTCNTCWDKLPEHIRDSIIPLYLPNSQITEYRTQKILKYLKKKGEQNE